ncbi:uncharacterized protein LOC110010077 isoform X2 [Jatropha curcas]|uniref:uncharacterized protein LOC110010077 isoform X2 n=1 Tax=Jatropha curcas TaxID=180498 RepID=UPI001895E538|nr:uncharacterized protein LOC110010077 isoform X2 [Jatropha curcas]
MALTASSSLSLNVGNFVTLKLTSNNYLLWCEQVLGLAESQDLLTHLTDQPQTNPARFDKATDQAIQNFTAWQKSDRLLRGWIIGTLSEESLGLIIGLDTAYAVWEALKESYAQASQEQEFTLRQQLTYLRKEESVDINNHIRKFKSICDSLAAIGHPISDREKVYNLLTSLGPQFETFTTTMLKPPRPTYTELIAHLQNHDQRRTWFANNGSPPLSVHSPHLAFYTQQQKSSQSSGARSNRPNFSSVGRGFQAQTSPAYTGQPRRPAPLGKRRMTAAKRELYQNETCQICIKKGHIAKICWWYSPSSSSNDLPQALATLTLDNTIADHDWTSDTGATNHMAGCSEKYKGYRCFDVQQRKYIISRSVVFDEQSFPYKSQAQITSTGNAGQIIDNWTSPTQADTFFETQSTEQIPHIPLPMTLPHAITPPLHNSTPATPQTPTSSQASSSQPSNPPSPITNSPPPSPIINLLLPSPLPTELTVAPVPEPDAFVQIAPSRSDQTLDSAPPQIEVPTQSDDDSTLNTRPTSPTAVSSTTVIPADVSVAAPAPRHAMATRSKSGIVKPNPRYALLTTMNPLIPKEPRTVKQELLHPRWKRAMEEELTALHKNETWTLVPRQAHMNIIGFRWVFKAKLKADGSLDRLKARLVAKGFHQVAGQDYTETFSPVIKPGLACLIVSP